MVSCWVFSEAALDTWKSVLGAHFRSREGAEYVTAREGYRKATNALFEDPLDEDAWMRTFRQTSRDAMRTEPGALDTIRALDKTGLHLGIVSDIDTAEAHSMLSGFGVESCFDAVTTSEDVSYTKPDARMFADAKSKLPADVATDRTLMVGDRYRHDVAGASEAGFAPVAYGEDAAGPAADYEITALEELLDVVGAEAER
jgi:putative hydrolase of the HAD superfamily